MAECDTVGCGREASDRWRWIRDSGVAVTQTLCGPCGTKLEQGTRATTVERRGPAGSDPDR